MRSHHTGGPPPGHRASTVASQIRAAVVGLLAAGVLAVALAGAPVALVVAGSQYLPASVPSVDEAMAALSRPDDGSLFLAMLVVVGWLAWATLTISVIVEVAARLRGVRVPALPAMRLQQRMAGALVGAVIAAFAAPAVASAAPMTATVTAVADQTPGPSTSTEVTQEDDEAAPRDAAQTAPPASRIYTVQPGDSLWSVAERELGDGQRFRELAAINQERVQPGGASLAGTDNWLYPGWQLELPPVAATPTPDGDAATHTVQPGDTLAEVADRTLGDPARWPEIYEATRGTVQPDGGQLSDPDLIRPGWVLSVPTAVVTATPAEATAPLTAEAAEMPPDPAPEPVLQPEPGPDPASDPVGGSAARHISGPAADAADMAGADEAFPLRSAAGMSSLAAAGLLALLGARRRNQHRRRAHGAAVMLPAGESADFESDLRAAADPMSVAEVDAALRTLGQHLATTGAPVPGLRAARVAPEGLDLFFDSPMHEGPPGWQPGEGGTVWAVPTGVLAAIDGLTAEPAAPPADVPSPYPALVTLGQDDGGHVLVNLEHIGLLGVTGDPEAARGVVAALVLELATSRWADDLTLTLVGDWPEMEEVLATGRIRYVPSVHRILDEVESRAAADRAALLADRLPDVASARVRGMAPDTWTPEVLILAGEISGYDARRLHDIVATTPRLAVCAVALGTGPGEWHVDVTPPADPGDPPRLVLEPVGLDLIAQHVDDGALHRFLQVVQVTDVVPEVTVRWAEPTLTSVDDVAASVAIEEGDVVVVDVTDNVNEGAGMSVDTDAGVERRLPEGAPAVLVLGPVEVRCAAGPVEPTKRHRLTELAAYLALNPGQAYAALDEALWPGRRVSVNARNTMVSKLRRWLGQDRDGQPYLPLYSSENGYRLSDDVFSDWDEWWRLLPGGAVNADTAALRSALGLVRGRPFDGVRTRAYTWAEYPRQRMIGAIVDACSELARRDIEEGRFAGAEEVATQGLMLEPGMERLWRLRILAAHGRRDTAAVRRIVDRMLATMDELGGDLEPETEQLLGELEGGRPVSAALRVAVP